MDKWQCVPMAFGLVTGIDYKLFMQRLGHDGSQIVDRSMREPLCRRGFTCQEMLSILPEFGWAGTRLDVGCRINSYDRVETQYYYDLNRTQNGVLFLSSRMHAVAWMNGRYYDHTGVITIDPEIICYVPLFPIGPGVCCQNQIKFEIAIKDFSK